ncbi:MAG: GHKL domain-containing protein [Clostridiaceae bacterium]|nr:GHKL domain-containing protein [Clostridiaceae bacterium]
MKVNFEVSAKAARLIGRENISDVDGALSELIKNAYDADASCVYVDFYIPFTEVPSQVTPDRFSSVLTATDLVEIMNFYHLENGYLVRKEGISDKEKQRLQDVLFRYNRIIVADNGEGMPMDIVSSSWMQIATSSKESDIESTKGRIKTGAKGIGRFALDKLSVRSVMYTKSQTKRAIRWEVNWDQFTNAQLLSEVYADVQETEDTFEKILYHNLDSEALESISKFPWKTGTIFILSPLREAWNSRLFAKVNTNLKSINPLGSVDEFNVFVRNRTMPEYSYRTEKVSIAKNDYDYRIKVDFDGNNTLKIKITRNEFDISKKYAIFSVGETEQRFPLSEFWTRAAFSKAPFHKTDIDGKTHEIILSVDTFIPSEDKDLLRAVGSYSAELFFIKNGKSDFDIVKDVPVRQRRDILRRFSGIKLYRDNFKVRPYGDEGVMFDWLDLDGRANKSPAGVSHLHGQWRVRSYQMIGVVNISRIENIALYDMANREGLTQNESYYYFVRMLQEAIARFEYDRQYIYREYARWSNSCKEKMATTAKRIEEDVLTHGVEKFSKKSEKSEKERNYSNAEEIGGARFTEREYRETVEELLRKEKQNLKAKQTLELISSAGVILNTFFHEFKALQTQLSTRVSQMRVRIDNLLGNKPYQGKSFLNPYEKLADFEYTDKILSAWLQVAMRAIEKDKSDEKEIFLGNKLNEILTIWRKLLEEKCINIVTYPVEFPQDFCKLCIASVDIYVIVNNFILNSVWFLEKEFKKERNIYISLTEQKKEIFVRMENNGPPLSERYRDSPMQIFNIGESEKKDGTGLGLFLMREVVERTNGEIYLLDKTDGFGIEIKWIK